LSFVPHIIFEGLKEMWDYPTFFISFKEEWDEFLIVAVLALRKLQTFKINNSESIIWR